MTTPPSPVHPGEPSGPPSPPPADARDGSTRRPVLLVALAVVAALVVGGGAFALTRALSGGGDQPASALPAGTAAYLRLDINPSVGQKIAAVQFLEGLDNEVTDALRSEDVRKEVFELVAAEEPALAEIDYDRDIAPWLGDRLGVGVVPSGEDEPVVALSLQVKDQEAADEGLTRLLDAGEAAAGESTPVGWFFHGDYAVVTERDHVAALEEQVAEGTLDEQSAFAGDLEALGDPGVLSFWVDGAALSPYLDDAAAMAESAPLEEAPLGGPGWGAFMFDQDLAATAGEGRVVAAVRFGTDHVELHGLARDVPAAIEGGDSAQLLLDLPEDTAVAFGLEHGDQVVAAVWEQLTEAMPEDMADVQAEAEAAGWSLPQDVQTMVGQSLALAVGPESANPAVLEDFTAFPLAYRVSTDTAAAEAVLDRALGQLDPSAESMLARSTDDGVLTLGLNQAYVDEVSAGGSLGSLSTFRAAVPGAEGADSILFVNLNRYEELYLSGIEDEQARASVESIAAIGMSATWSGQEGEFTFRVVAD